MPPSTSTADRKTTAPAQVLVTIAGMPDDDPGAAPLADRRRERFSQLVAQGFSQTDAYAQAYQVTDYQRKTLTEQSSRAANDRNTAARIDYLRRYHSAHDAAAFAVTRARVLAEVARMALADPRKLLGPDGRPLPLSELPDDIAAAVEQVDILTGPDGQPTAWRYKLARKSTATDQLARMLGMYEQDNKQRAGSLADALAQLAEQSGAAPSLAARLAMPADAPAAAPEPQERPADAPDGPAPV